MQGERQAASHGACRTPAPGGPCPHARGLDGAPEELRNSYALQHISARLLRRGGVAARQMFTRGGGGTNNEEFRDTSGGAPSGLATHEKLVLNFLEGASEIKIFDGLPCSCKNNSLQASEIAVKIRAKNWPIGEG